MSIDPARLARIKARLVAAAAVTAAIGCGGGNEHVNTRPPDAVNEPPAAPTAEPDQNPAPDHVNTPAPDSPAPDHVNTPPKDR